MTILQQAKEIPARMQKMGEELKAKRVYGESGGVRVEMNGLTEVLAIDIAQNLLADKAATESHVRTAVNQAAAQARQLHAEAMKQVTGGMNLPGLEETLGKLGPLPR
jgi:DNA-binding YbaB/EbfC family protein